MAQSAVLNWWEGYWVNLKSQGYFFSEVSSL